MKKYVLYAKISSWVGLSIGATHMYCNLCWEDEKGYHKIELHRNLTQEDADILNKKDKVDFYKLNDTTNRFDSEEQIYETIIDYVKHSNVPFKLIVKGDNFYAEVQEAIWGPEKIVKKINKLYKEYEKYQYLDNYTPEMDKINNEFDKILETI